MHGESHQLCANCHMNFPGYIQDKTPKTKRRIIPNKNKHDLLHGYLFLKNKILLTYVHTSLSVYWCTKIDRKQKKLVNKKHDKFEI